MARQKLTVALYLHSAGNANSRKGDGRLTAHAPDGDEPRDVFVYDPEVPVYAPGGPQALSGPYDQAVPEMGNNLLVYTSDPVNRETEIFGQPRIRLFAVTSAAQADFTAKIVRVTSERPCGVSLHRHRAQLMAVPRQRIHSR